jgi:homer protein
MGELPIFTTKAHVFHIDPDTKKKWLPLSTQAVTVSYYHDSTRLLYRIISVDGTKVLVNSTLTPNMTFTKTSQKFGQWSDNKANTVYGLGFASEDDLVKFMDKFNEVKSVYAGAALPESNRTSQEGSVTVDNKQIANNLQNNLPENKPSQELHDQLEVLRYENDRLKIALAQSSVNAKKWEAELQTLRNNNARLTAALQESASNVEQWKKQLQTYKDENTRLQSQATTNEQQQADSRENVERQLAETLKKLRITEQLLADKKKETDDHKLVVANIKTVQSINEQLQSKLQALATCNKVKCKLCHD